MNIEIKNVLGNDYYEYQSFGWIHIKDERKRKCRGYKTFHIFERDKDIENYNKIVELEKEYFKLKNNKRTNKKIDPFTCIISFIFFIFPGFIYLYYISKENKNIDQINNEIESEMLKISKRAEAML